MTDRDAVLAVHPDAVCVTNDALGSTDYLIRTDLKPLTGWCPTEARAWELARELLYPFEEIL